MHRIIGFTGADSRHNIGLWGPKPTDPVGRLLGGLRFALATIVVGAHLVWFSPNSHLTKLAYFSAIAAVLGFLMVSGYSIAHSLAQSETGFYRRRLRRIMPLYVLALCLGFAIGRMPGFEQWGGFAKLGFDQLICNFFFLQP